MLCSCYIIIFVSVTASLELLISIVFIIILLLLLLTTTREWVVANVSRYLFLTLWTALYRPDQTFNFQLLYTALPFQLPATFKAQKKSDGYETLGEDLVLDPHVPRPDTRQQVTVLEADA